MRFEQRSHEIEHALGVPARSHVVESPRYPALAIKDEGRPIGHTFVENAERPRQVATRVREQDEWERVLFGECAMRFDRVRAHPNYYALLREELFMQFAEFLAFDRAPGRIVLRIKVEDYVPATIVGQPMRPSILIGQSERKPRGEVRDVQFVSLRRHGLRPAAAGRASW